MFVFFVFVFLFVFSEWDLVTWVHPYFDQFLVCFWGCFLCFFSVFWLYKNKDGMWPFRLFSRCFNNLLIIVFGSVFFFFSKRGLLFGGRL